MHVILIRERGGELVEGITKMMLLLVTKKENKLQRERV